MFQVGTTLLKYFNIPVLIAGLFTQVVWKGTKYVGVGIAQNDTYVSVVIAANYFPPGNIVGKLKKKNV